MSHLVQARKVRVAFPQVDGTLRVVLMDVDLCISKGEFMTLMGPSGSGKSVLMRTISGAQRPTSGRIVVDGEEVRRVNRDRGMVYQKYGLFPNLTVRQNIALGPILERSSILGRCAGLLPFTPYRRTKREALAAAEEYLSHIGLEKADGDKYPLELSGGMQQRVAIAQAVLMKPKLLFMDEAFGALDPIVRRDMQEFLLKIWQETGITIVFVTHDKEEGLYLGTRLVAVSRYWTYNDGRPSDGAKIVFDKQIPNALEKGPEWRFSQEFTGLLQKLERDAMDKSYCQPIKDFDLTHPDAIRPEEG